MKEKPDSPGLWTREGKFYRVWTVDGRWFTQEITPSDGGLWPIYERNESSPFPPGNWHKLTAPATNAAAREKFHGWLKGHCNQSSDEQIADKAAEIFVGVEREPGATGFTECDTCSAKPGSPLLCAGCLANRELIGKLQRRLDPSICRLQFPDGGVPEDIQGCAEGWKAAYDAKFDNYRIAVKQIEDLETQVHQIAGLKGIIARQDEEITTLKATVEKLEGEVATEHAKYINSERAATVALQAQTILKQAEEIAELRQQPEVIEGKGQADRTGIYAYEQDGKVYASTWKVGEFFYKTRRYIYVAPIPTFPPRKPAFVAPPKPEQFLYRWRRLNGTEEVFWTTKRSEGHYIGVLDGCMYTSGELIDEKTGEPIKEPA